MRYTAPTNPHRAHRSGPRRALAGAASIGIAASTLAGIIPSSATPSLAAPGPVTVSLYYDGNFDSARNANETFGPGGVVVRAYDVGNVLAGTGVTDENGNVTFTPTGSGPWRVEVDHTTLPAGLEPAAVAGGGSTITFFLDGGQSTAVGVWEPQRYSAPGQTPGYAINQMSSIFGSPTDPALQTHAPASGPLGANTGTVSTVGQVGATFGIAYSPSRAAFYQAAYNKVLAATPNPGAIYRNGALFATIPGATAGNVGESGLGGMDLMDDTTLYVTNLDTSQLVPVDASTGAVGAGIPVPGIARPMGVKVHNGLVYVGGVSTDRMTATVAAYNPVTNVWTTVWTQSLAYPRGTSAVVNGGTVALDWRPNGSTPTEWPNAAIPLTYQAINPTAALSDIEFLNDGSMVVGIRDIFGDAGSANQDAPYALPVSGSQGAVFAASDQLVAPRASNVSFGTATTERWDDDSNVVMFGGQTPPQHREANGGTMLALPDGTYVTPAVDPMDCRTVTMWGSVACSPISGAYSIMGAQIEEGVAYYSQAGGLPTGGNVLSFGGSSADPAYPSRAAAGVARGAGGFGKGGGLGDLVALTAPAPIEIGNRVWLDTNGNGIQDPKTDLNGDGDFADPNEDATNPEPGIAGVTVQLLNAAGAVIQTTTTGIDGNYVFSGLAPNTTYTIRIPDGQTQITGIPFMGSAAFGALPLTTANVDGLIDQGDSDFTGTGDYDVTVTTGFSGANNHTFDAGLLAAVDLSLEKYVNPDGSGFVDADATADAPFISADAPYTYRITVSNAASVPATGVSVADVLPAGVTFVSATAGGTASGQNVTWTGLTVPGNGSIDLDITVVVNAADAGVFAAGARAVNSAQITASDLPDIDSTPGNDPDPTTPQNEDDDDPALVQMAADVSLVKLVDPNATDGNAAGDFVEANSAPGPVIRAARNFTYRIVATNAGPSAARNVVVRDVLPADVQFVSATMGGVNTAGTVDWTINLAPGETVNLDVTVVVPHANVAAFLGNQTRLNPAQVASNPIPDPDSTPGNDPDPATPQNEDDDDPASVFLPIADLEVVKRINAIDNGVDAHGNPIRTEPQIESTTPLTVDVGSEITWQIQVTNIGPDAATGVIVNDVLPASTRYVASSSLNGAYDPATGLWTLANPIPAGGQATLSIRAILLPATVGQQTADVAPVVNVTAVQAVNEADPDSIPGDPVVTNQDDNDDAVLNPQAAAIGNVVWHDLDGDGTQDSGEPGIAGVQVTLTIDAPITTSTGTVLIPAGTTWVTSTNPDGTYIFHNLPASAAGIPYHVSVASPGTDWLPTGQDAGTDDAIDSDADPATGVMAQTTLTPGERDLTWDAGFFLPAELALVKTVTGLSGTAHDAIPHGANAPAASGDPCNLTPPAGGSADGGCDLVDVGAPFTYTITVSNSGPGVARNVVVNEAFPAAMTVRSVSAVVGASTVTLDPAATSWTLPDLGVDETAVITVTAVVSTAQASSYLAADGRTVFGLENRASVTTSTPDDPSIPEADSPNVDVASHQPVLFVLPSIIKEVNTGRGWFDANDLPSAQLFRFGQDMQYRITVRNAGNITATGMTVTDVLPANVGYVSADPSQGSFDRASNLWTIGPVGADGSATLVITAKVPTADRGAFTVGDSRINTAVLSPADQPLDPRNPAPDYDDPAVITPPASLGNFVWLDADRDGVQDPGERGVEGVLVTIRDAAGNVVTTTRTDGSGLWLVTNLDPGAYTAEFDQVPDRWVNTISRDVPGVDGDSNGVRATSISLAGGGSDETLDLGLIGLIDLSVEKVLVGEDRVDPGSTVTWEIRVTNRSETTALPGWSVTDLLPDGWTLVSIGGGGYTCDGLTCTSDRSLAPGETSLPIVVQAVAPMTRGVSRNVTYVTPAPGEMPETNPLDIPTRDTDTADSRTNNDSSSEVRVGPPPVIPITGGTIAGLVGAAAAIGTVGFGLRWFGRRRREDRVERGGEAAAG